MIMAVAYNTGYLQNKPSGLGIDSSELKVTNENKYDMNFNNPKPIRYNFNFLIGYMLIVFHKDPNDTYTTTPIKENNNQYNWYTWFKFTNGVGDKEHIIGGLI